MADKMYTGFDGRLNIHDSRAFCAVTAMIIEKYGYVSKAKAMEWGTEATTCRVNENVDILENGPDGRRPYEEDFLYQERLDWYRKMIEFAKTYQIPEEMMNVDNFVDVDDSSDFAFNMRSAFDAFVKYSAVTRQTAGFIVYGMSKLIETKKEKVEWKENDRYEVGMKLKKVPFTIFKRFDYDTMYGAMSTYILRDENGIRAKWSTGTFISDDMLVDCMVILNGTVTDLEDHPKYGKAVVLKRCRVQK